MTNDRSRAKFDVVVVGAGQAGLAIGYYLARQGRRFVILDRADSVGAAWRDRWDSLVLFTPRRYDSLPGLPFPGDPNGYPTRDEVVAYLEHYAETFALPIQLDSAVKSLTEKSNTFVLGLDDRTIEADQVVVATGPYQMPRVPDFAADLAPDVFQIHSADYRTPSDIPKGTVVVVVGGGNTGYQIASELSTAHHVRLAIGGRQTPLPQKLLGRDLFWWLMSTRLLKATVDSRLGQKLSRRDTLIGSSPRALKRDGGGMKPRLTSASGRTVNFADGTELSVDAVIWASGFDLDTWTTPGLTFRSRTRTARYAIDAESPLSRASTSSGSPGSTRADQRYSVGSKTTLNRSLDTSLPARQIRSRARPSRRLPKPCDRAAHPPATLVTGGLPKTKGPRMNRERAVDGLTLSGLTELALGTQTGWLMALAVSDLTSSKRLASGQRAGCVSGIWT